MISYRSSTSKKNGYLLYMPLQVIFTTLNFLVISEKPNMYITMVCKTINPLLKIQLAHFGLLLYSSALHIFHSIIPKAMQPG